MFAAAGTALVSAIGSIGMKMLSAALFERLIIWAIKKMAANSKFDWDDQLVEMIEGHLEKKKED